MLTHLRNQAKLARSNRLLDPQVAIYYLTEQCNFNCVYCEDFGARRNNQNQSSPPIKDVLLILKVIRTGVDTLMLTGGEPFTHPEVDEILTRAKEEYRFREVTLLSNGSLLGEHEKALTSIDRLIISLDSIDSHQSAKIAACTESVAQKTMENITHFATLQKRLGFQMVINTVLTPETISGVEALLEFCIQNKLLISFSPQAVNNWPAYELTVSNAYRELIQWLLKQKKAGAPILGSDIYLKTLSDFRPYDCLPALAPRIYPNGDLSYPCRPLEKAMNGQGGRPVNLLNVNNWKEAWDVAVNTYGQPPRTCHSCFQQCYAEPSLMQTHSLNLLKEWLLYPTSKAGNLQTYAPG